MGLFPQFVFLNAVCSFALGNSFKDLVPRTRNTQPNLILSKTDFVNLLAYFTVYNSSIIGILCVYAIRSSRHCEGSQMPPG